MTKHLFRLALALAVAATSSAPALVQNESAPSTAAAQTASPQITNRTTADETFELNITERRITEHDFAASAAVEAGEETARSRPLTATRRFSNASCRPWTKLSARSAESPGRRSGRAALSRRRSAT